MWSPNSWKRYTVKHVPLFDDNQMDLVKKSLHLKDPLVQISEIINLNNKLSNLKKNNGFIVHMGECAETFSQSNLKDVSERNILIDNFSKILEIKKNILKIGRIAGQYAKPRSNDKEYHKEIVIPSYKGDIAHDFQSDSRSYDPSRLLLAYKKSKQTINFLKKIKSQMFISHEALILDYEEALTYQENKKYFNLSTHLPWLGDKTRFLDSAHVEYLSGISNPVAVKLSHNININELKLILNKLRNENPLRQIIIISRFGVNNINKLRPYIEALKSFDLLWMIDPMHGNNYMTEKNIKTRDVSSIIEEINIFTNVLKETNEYFAGIHLETTPLDVTECIDNEITKNKLEEKYLTYCDPRLNKKQTLYLAEHIKNIL